MTEAIEGTVYLLISSVDILSFCS